MGEQRRITKGLPAIAVLLILGLLLAIACGSDPTPTPTPEPALEAGQRSALQLINPLDEPECVNDRSQGYQGRDYG